MLLDVQNRFKTAFYPRFAGLDSHPLWLDCVAYMDEINSYLPEGYQYGTVINEFNESRVVKFIFSNKIELTSYFEISSPLSDLFSEELAFLERLRKVIFDEVYDLINSWLFSGFIYRISNFFVFSNIDDVFGFLVIFLIFSSLVFGVILEVLWYTHFFNKRHSANYCKNVKKSYTNFIIPNINKETYFYNIYLYYFV